MSFNTAGSWMPVALSSNLPRLVVMPVWLGGETVALWRSASGSISASSDRCPHRGMRLSHGFVRGEALSCIYHGWSYGQEGRCLKIPAHPGLTPPDTIRVATYAVTEQDGIIWAATATSRTPPPRVRGLAPLRSISATASLKAIEAAAGASIDASGFLSPQVEIAGLCLLLSDQGNGETLMHVLVPENASPGDRINASRAAEVLRRRAEALAFEGVAA
ncbi:Rieske 2Fe-2S domain-containing protein [Agrobacterium pusense]|jgi:nitrite reductase/ring-hydroxylating ferredoxin subunit|uniref:Rieske 2Fe-2S domain-containing protein n=1 Tax=Agrobacterium pusense TaxID=648995 RepID=UPI002452FA67|nr:Rieske 2Fe-2S domain-containing protein [Agrobacterium pusense]